MAGDTHAFTPDPRNERVLIDINGALTPRAKAVISVYDSGFMLGDGIWEGLRVHHGRIAFLDRHLDRLYEGAKALDMDIGQTRQQMTERLYSCLRANLMKDGGHIRLTVTRGIRPSAYHDPHAAVSPATIVIIPEYREPHPEAAENGIRLCTVNMRCGGPAAQDQRPNSPASINSVTAGVQATKAGFDDVLMLGPDDCVAASNAAHFFIARKGEIWAPNAKYRLDGITRGIVIELCREAGIPVLERDFSLTDIYAAEEAFVTGTFAGIVPVREVDNCTLTKGRGPMTERLQSLYQARLERECAE